MLELHIWGPAFELPSFDAECLATIQYLRNVLPNESWVLIPSSNPYNNPFHKLPALRNDADWVAGFDNIQQYLSHISDGSWDIDRNLSDTQIADCDAYKSFLYSRGLPLLDLSLFVSSENYTSYTRAALSELLAWPQSWVIPHQLREQAKKRSEHLGLSALDVDAAEETEAEDAGLTAHIPKALRKPKQTVSGLLGRNIQKTRFRLDAATENFLEPMYAKLSNKDWLIADKMCSADCLATAILSLMQISSLTQAWLHDALKNKFSTLGQWAEMQRRAAYGNTFPASSVLSGEQSERSLPWAPHSPPSWTEASMFAVEAMVSSIPILRSGHQWNEIPKQSFGPGGKVGRKQQAYAKIRNQQRLYSQVVTICIGATSVLGWAIQTSLLNLPHFQRAKPIRRSFGEAGAILGL